MLSKNERMNKLVNAGIDTGKYFNINLPEGLAPGATISVVINENGQLVFAGNNKDSIAEQIITDGYVRNTKLHRRFVMAQMFHMLNYVSYDGKDRGYTACLHHHYDYNYTLKMMLEEVRVLSKLEVRDKESFDERSHFFTKDVVIRVLNDYLDKLKKYIDSLPTKKCKGVPYKRVKSADIFVSDLNKKIYYNVDYQIRRINCSCSYTELYNTLHHFVANMIKLPYNTPKSQAWIDAFKGEGAYYTLKNLIMYHNCCVYYGNEALTQKASMMDLEHKLVDYKNEGWRMFAFMKKVITDNNFNFNARMKEIYNQ